MTQAYDSETELYAAHDDSKRKRANRLNMRAKDKARRRGYIAELPHHTDSDNTESEH